MQLLGVTRKFNVPGQPTVTAVDQLDLSIRPGEVVALLGPNGAGKTTTLDMVLGLIAPSDGTVRVFGQSPRKAITAGRVSAVLQTGGLLADLTVSETVRIIASTFNETAGVSEVIERSGLTPIKHRKVSKCSGGEQQRLRFALALLPDPDLLILDEPTAGMDVHARREFWQVMHQEAEAGRTIVFATHYLEEADSFADRIVLIAGGRIVADGPTEQIRAHAMGRTITAELDDPASLEQLIALTGVKDASLEDGRVHVSVSMEYSDTVALTMLQQMGARQLEIVSGSLESAFVTLTTEPSGENR